MRRLGYEAMLTLPIVSGDRSLGALAFGSAEERSWPDELVIRLRLVAEVLANALARKQTEDALRASEAMKSSILHSLRSGVAVVDRDGRVLALNDNWTRLVRESGDLAVSVGENLLESADVPGGSHAPLAELGSGVLSVLQGSRDSFGYEYTTQSGKDPRWWSTVVVPLERPEGGAVVTRADVTDLRRAELDVQRVRQELAHVGRVSIVGELTASLAHEIYQPLTAIMTNAQAARRMLAATPPDVVTGAGDPLRHRQGRPARERCHRAAARSAAQGRAGDGARRSRLDHPRRGRSAPRRVNRQTRAGGARSR